MTGTRASFCTRSIRLFPPRGTMTSMLSVMSASMKPTAARSAVGTSWMQLRGSRAGALGACPQDHRIAGFQAQRACIRGHVRAALVDDADDPERHPDALDIQAIRP